MSEPRILLIEDDPDVQALLREMLAMEGYRVPIAPGTLDPVDVSQLRPCRIVLDLWLAGQPRGVDWLETLRLTPGARDIPVVICTADGDLARREGARLQALAADVVLKPFDVDDFAARVAAAGPPQHESGHRGTV